MPEIEKGSVCPIPSGQLRPRYTHVMLYEFSRLYMHEKIYTHMYVYAATIIKEEEVTNLGGSAGDMGGIGGGRGRGRVESMQCSCMNSKSTLNPLRTSQFFDIRPYPIYFFSTNEDSVRFSEHCSWVCPSLCSRETSCGKLISKNQESSKKQQSHISRQ